MDTQSILLLPGEQVQGVGGIEGGAIGAARNGGSLSKGDGPEYATLVSVSTLRDIQTVPY